MHQFLKLLARQRLSWRMRYGLPVAAILLATLLRLVAPLDTAPFLLYMPVIFLATLALGRGPGFVALAASTLAAAYFFAVDDEGPTTLSVGEIVALVQNLIVGTGMVVICEALRRAFVESEGTLGKLDHANRVLNESRASLEIARADAEDALRAAEDANRAKSAFLANMSHELRTPLSAVIGYSEMLEEEAEELGAESFLGDLGKIKSNAQHLLSLINDVLDLSKVEANKMDLYAEEIDVATFARDAAATVEALVRKKENVLVLDLDPDLGTITSDTVKLRQCAFNLLSNASKFTEKGQVTLRVRRDRAAEGDWVSFAVIDTGIGMSAEQVERLFQRFMQADESTTRRFGGTGLGLALSRALSQLLGGDITVESTEGRGTTFTLRVPATLPIPAPEPPVAFTGPTRDLAETGEPDLVLVIDDEASQRELMTRFLTRQGIAVRTAVDGRSGLELARALKPRVILLDVMMPDMDGWSVLRALKNDPDLAAIPVVMISFVADAALGASLGAAEY